MDIIYKFLFSNRPALLTHTGVLGSIFLRDSYNASEAIVRQTFSNKLLIKYSTILNRASNGRQHQKTSLILWTFRKKEKVKTDQHHPQCYRVKNALRYIQVKEDLGALKRLKHEFMTEKLSEYLYKKTTK